MRPPTARAILVLGPHRSGTSAVTRVLNLLGVHLGRDLLPPKFDNPLGYWENRTAFELQEELLAAAGSAWHEYRPMPADWRDRPSVRELRATLRSFLVQEFGDEPLWGIKDPRLCQLLPVWIDVLDELEIEAHCVVVVRNPLEVARSLQWRDGFDFGKCVLIYLAGILMALQHTTGRQRAFVSYGLLLEDWRQAVGELGRALQVEWPRSPAGQEADLEAYLRPAERHHRCAPGELGTVPQIPAWSVDLYEALEKASRGEDRDLGPAFRTANDAFTASLALFVPELERSAAQTARLAAEIAGLERRAEEAEAELSRIPRGLWGMLSTRLHHFARRLVSRVGGAADHAESSS